MIEPTLISTNFPVIDARLSAAPDILLEEMVPGVVEGQLLLEREIRERTPTSGAGTLRDSIGALPVVVAQPVITGDVGTSLSYAQPVELGSRPHMPPVEPLVDWVRRKLGKRGKEGRGIAFAIARKIAKEGTPAVHMFEEGLKATQAQIQQLLAEAAARGVVRAGQ
ncbi:HK97 gp10 family phage protein [Ancylobacter lacus]|uniref:HK97 gp10 family phage protein n=1 Tax=Ancylobacter lacus TaxID=2579970 RepID=UPI001BCE8427|nr:HK97 gp10 family phage protein [Ancylobacter lacus]MBS7539756.1 HK97 gp10 family phage protein [Ancylobacter lacus]